MQFGHSKLGVRLIHECVLYTRRYGKSFVLNALTWVHWAHSRIIEEESNVKNKENDTDGALLQRTQRGDNWGLGYLVRISCITLLATCACSAGGPGRNCGEHSGGKSTFGTAKTRTSGSKTGALEYK